MAVFGGPEDAGKQVKRIIDEAMTALQVVGCSHDTAASLLIMQGTVRLNDNEERKKMRDAIDSLIWDYDDLRDCADVDD